MSGKGLLDDGCYWHYAWMDFKTECNELTFVGTQITLTSVAHDAVESQRELAIPIPAQYYHAHQPNTPR